LLVSWSLSSLSVIGASGGGLAVALLRAKPGALSDFLFNMLTLPGRTRAQNKQHELEFREHELKIEQIKRQLREAAISGQVDDAGLSRTLSDAYAETLRENDAAQRRKRRPRS
jgi:hypothetical protein